ncbi:2-succinyl-5-enolpyruvyl-6-hydroxy-3-cyclohexene-1-carboxylate synthase [Listeria grandensis FSL F6-0971]|uniref:2-succinyl-5-enolpyruvyl-6-hydroxy-3-cyclohexene-1-carboxylate synthase n=1 Tax=Listeria grandensis FSL F6-0971 TaxID=1265819 RepID=W7B3T9_9LIST|nr:2-succinyl-5-enolpyruvyl-6-hydroxy-3-cyclohexene-1-carboxylate synthase [Listeria grandensis FSL F6-0971]
MNDHRQVMTEYLAAFIEELVQAGVKEAVISLVRAQRRLLY